MGTLLFVLSFALLAVQASATLPISDVSSSKVRDDAHHVGSYCGTTGNQFCDSKDVRKKDGRAQGGEISCMKSGLDKCAQAQAVNRMAKKHMLAEQGNDEKEVVGFGGMHYKR